MGLRENWGIVDAEVIERCVLQCDLNMKGHDKGGSNSCIEGTTSMYLHNRPYLKPCLTEFREKLMLPGLDSTSSVPTQPKKATPFWGMYLIN